MRDRIQRSLVFLYVSDCGFLLRGACRGFDDELFMQKNMQMFC